MEIIIILAPRKLCQVKWKCFKSTYRHSATQAWRRRKQEFRRREVVCVLFWSFSCPCYQYSHVSSQPSCRCVAMWSICTIRHVRLKRYLFLKMTTAKCTIFASFPSCPGGVYYTFLRLFWKFFKLYWPILIFVVRILLTVTKKIPNWRNFFLQLEKIFWVVIKKIDPEKRPNLSIFPSSCQKTEMFFFSHR